MEAKIYNQNGKEAGKIDLPKDVFGQTWNADLVHQVVVSMMSNARENVAHAKTRGEVSGTGKKPWKQKGTGRARHGSMRSPLWVGGGVAHGPRNDKNFDRKVGKKMKAKALYTILSRKFKDGEILFVDNFDFAKPKTADAVDSLKSLSSVKGYEKLIWKKGNVAWIGQSSEKANTVKSFGNIGTVCVDELRNLSPVKAMNHKFIIIENPKESLKLLSGKLEK